MPMIFWLSLAALRAACAMADCNVLLTVVDLTAIRPSRTVIGLPAVSMEVAAVLVCTISESLVHQHDSDRQGLHCGGECSGFHGLHVEQIADRHGAADVRR